MICDKIQKKRSCYVRDLHSEGVFMGRTGKYLCLIGTGGSLYYVFEQLFRGFSHWSMFLLGGICFLFIYLQGSKIGWDDPLWKQILRCDTFVVSMEFMTGIVVNCMNPQIQNNIHFRAFSNAN